MHRTHRRGRRCVAAACALAALNVSSVVFACADHSSPLCLCPTPLADGTHDHSQGLAPLTRGSGIGGGLDSQATQTVWVFNFDYSINQSFGKIIDATINAGDTIRWEWEFAGFHTVTSVAGSAQNFNSGLLSNVGSTFFQPFNTPGVYTYFCQLHGFDNGDGTADGMSGTITVLQQAVSSSWNVDFDGSWNTASNWTNSQIPNSAGSTATFGPIITGPRGVTVDSPVTVGSLNFQTNSTHFYNIGGGSTISLAGTAGRGGTGGTGGGNAVVHVINNNQSIGAKLQPVSDTVFQIDGGARLTATQLQETSANLTKTGAGSLVVNRVVTPASLTISAGTVRTLTGTSRVGSLTIDTSSPNFGTLDLLDQDLIVLNSTYSAITSLISAARAGGNWNQPGITSASALFASPRNTTLGTLTGAQLLGVGVTTFGGFNVAASDTLVKYTYYGDTDFNGVVNFDDYARTDSGFNTGGSDWFHGDFDYNGLVNFDDYSLIDLSFNTQSGTLIRAIAYLDGSDPSSTGMDSPELQKVADHFAQFGQPYAVSFLNAVPEPSAIILPGVSALAGTCMRRRRRAQ